MDLNQIQLIQELADYIYNKIYFKTIDLEKILDNAYKTVEKNSYSKQINLWKDFFN